MKNETATHSFSFVAIHSIWFSIGNVAWRLHFRDVSRVNFLHFANCVCVCFSSSAPHSVWKRMLFSENSFGKWVWKTPKLIFFGRLCNRIVLFWMQEAFTQGNRKWKNFNCLLLHFSIRIVVPKPPEYEYGSEGGGVVGLRHWVDLKAIIKKIKVLEFN